MNSHDALQIFAATDEESVACATNWLRTLIARSGSHLWFD